jgi:hypothetical protein
MCLYVHPENQELLWNIVNQNQFLTAMLSNQTAVQKEKWFRSIIEHFYNMNKHRTLDKTQLNQLNKDTLSYMIQVVRAAPPTDNHFIYERNNNTISSFVDSSKEPANIPTPPLVPDTRADLFNRQFLDRQREYETMLEKKAPAEVNFSEKIEDGVISNMDELIKKQLQEREAEFKLYAPPPVINQNTTGNVVNPVNSAVVSSSPEKSPIELVKPNITFQIEQPSNNSDEITVLKNELAEMKLTIEKMKIELKSLVDRFDFGGNEAPLSRTQSGIIQDENVSSVVNG